MHPMELVLNCCPLCGHELSDKSVFGRTRRVCPACEFIFFRDPKVVVAALPAGYMEFDEDSQEATRREVEEETGIRVEVTGLMDVLPTNTVHGRGVLIVYWARPVGGTLRAGDNASDALWFTAEELPTELAFQSTLAAPNHWRNRRHERE